MHQNGSKTRILVKSDQLKKDVLVEMPMQGHRLCPVYDARHLPDQVVYQMYC